jgi:serine/threonine-protein kinase RsbW
MAAQPQMPDPLPSMEFDPRTLILKINMVVAADVKSINPVVDDVMEMAAKLECAKGKEMEIETALREALANAIIHGCENDPARRVQCCVACDESRGMLIVVRDPGEGFDPAQVPSPVMGENVFSSHGRGIFLINQLMDHVEFAHGGTEIRMKKR